MHHEPAWPLFDPSILNQFDAYLADQSGELLSVELSHIFFSRGVQLASRLLASLDSASHQELAFAAHSLKSSADNVGLVRLARLCEELELSGREAHSFSEILLHRQGFAELFEASTDALRRHIAEQKKPR